MKIEKNLVSAVALAGLLCILIFAGCASTQQKKIITNEKLLAAAGFKRYPADTPDKLERLKELPQQKIFTRTDGGREYYIYADAQHCRCLFKGGREEYERYQQLALDNQLTQDRQTNNKRDRNRTLDWGRWRFRDDW